MQIREYSLSAGWYPRDPEEVKAFLSGFKAKNADAGTLPSAKAAIAPHAGWFYSGGIAARAVSCLQPDAETIVVIGGHLPAGSPALFAMEDAVRTPFGLINIDKDLRSILMTEENCCEDRYRDNTVEVLLPMVHYFFPKANLLWLRLPADMRSFGTGKIISGAAAKLKRKVNVLGSTDLTHYGQNYGFSPYGAGQKALNWVREVNDANFIKAVEAANPDEVLLCAERDNSSCSAGAVLGALGFGEAEKLGKPSLLEYGTSASADPDRIPDSFVGYFAAKL